MSFVDLSNAPFEQTEASESWIEIYHSRPSWKATQISYKKDSASWVPFGSFKLIDATEVKEGFRAFRIRANRLEFRLCNGKGTSVDANSGRNYKVFAPGRYVVEPASGCRRVSDACVADCLRALRPKDCYVELWFETDESWRNCFMTFSNSKTDSNAKWHKIRMMRSTVPHKWSVSMNITRALTCAFTDGNGQWDSNTDQNYYVPMPGRYSLGCGRIVYEGPSRIDSHLR